MEDATIRVGKRNDNNHSGNRFRVQYDVRKLWNETSTNRLISSDSPFDSRDPGCVKNNSSCDSVHTVAETSGGSSSSTSSPSVTTSLSDYSWNAGCSITRFDSLDAFSSPSPTSSLASVRNKQRSMTHDNLSILSLPSHTDDNSLPDCDEIDEKQFSGGGGGLSSIARNHSSMKELFYDSSSISSSSRPVAPKRKKSHKVSYLTHKSMNRQSMRRDALDDTSWNSMFNSSVRRNEISQRKNASPVAGNRQQYYQHDNSNIETDSLLGSLPSPIETRHTLGDDVSISSKCDRSSRKQFIARGIRLNAILAVLFTLLALSIIVISCLGLRSRYPLFRQNLSLRSGNLDNNMQTKLAHMTVTSNKQNRRLRMNSTGNRYPEKY